MDITIQKTTLPVKTIVWKGSRLRCLLLTSMEKSLLQSTLINIINNEAVNGLEVKFTDEFEYFPKGLINPKEVELDKAHIPINGSIEYCKTLKNWWLGKRARTPVWDFICNAEINGTPGLILIEAKAHKNELENTKDKSKAQKGSLNRCKIKSALKKINELYCYKLSADDHFQLSNRIAWSIKLASLGIPVVLIYLGFLNTKEMTISKDDSLLSNAKEWETLVTKYSKDIDFEDWSKKISGEKLRDDSNLSESSFVYPIIRSINIQIETVDLSAKCTVE
jgi:hypothetical protein